MTGPADVLELVGGSGRDLPVEPRGPERPRDRLQRRHHQVLEAVPRHEPADLGAIAAAAGVAILETQRALAYLTERDFVVAEGAGWRLGDRALADLRGSALGSKYACRTVQVYVQGRQGRPQGHARSADATPRRGA